MDKQVWLVMCQSIVMVGIIKEYMMNLEQMVNDFAVVTYLKGNTWNRHEQQIRAEAMKRIHEHGAALVREESTAREYARLKQMVLDFEVQNGIK